VVVVAQALVAWLAQRWDAGVAERLGAGALLPCARALAERNGAERQRAVAAERGVRGLAAWQAARYADALPAPLG
jgi:hypothetical protein